MPPKIPSLNLPRAFWLGDHAHDYYERNQPTPARILQGIKVFQRAVPPFLRSSSNTKVLEVGVGSGVMFNAAWSAFNSTNLYGIDINPEAVAQHAVGVVTPGDVSAIPYAGESFDLVYTWGLLIHVAPGDIVQAYSELARVTRPGGWVLMMEYFNPEPEERSYHGREGVMWRRDFGHEFWQHHADWDIANYGFFWKPVDGADINWWLFRKPLEG